MRVHLSARAEDCNIISWKKETGKDNLGRFWKEGETLLEESISDAAQRVNIVWKQATLIWARLAYISRVLCLLRIRSFRWRVNIRSLCVLVLNDLVGSSRSSSYACSCFDRSGVRMETNAPHAKFVWRSWFAGRNWHLVVTCLKHN